jgi:hypothetical protein
MARALHRHAPCLGGAQLAQVAPLLRALQEGGDEALAQAAHLAQEPDRKLPLGLQGLPPGNSFSVVVLVVGPAPGP